MSGNGFGVRVSSVCVAQMLHIYNVKHLKAKGHDCEPG